MEEGGTASLDQMRRQHDALAKAAAEIVKAHEFFRIATEASIAIQRPADGARSAFRAIESFLNHEMSEIRAADGHADEANRLAANADRVGNGTTSQRDYRD